MKTTGELNIKDWSGYCFEEMINIQVIDPKCFMVSDAKKCTDGTMVCCYTMAYNGILFFIT